MELLGKYYEELSKEEQEIIKTEMYRQRTKKYGLTEEEKIAAIKKVSWSLKEIARCLNNGYVLTATIIDGELFHRATFRNPIAFYQSLLRYQLVKPRYLTYKIEKLEVNIHIENFNPPTQRPLWINNPKRIPGGCPHVMLWEKGCLSRDKYEKLLWLDKINCVQYKI